MGARSLHQTSLNPSGHTENRPVLRGSVEVKGLLLPDEKATLEAGAQLANELSQELVFLHGDLGAGKTTLVRGLLRSWGHRGVVKSPTYTLVEPYEIAGRSIYHFDFYRLTNPEEVDYLGIEDHFLDTNLCVIEWADKVADAIPPADLIILLQTDGAGRRLHCQTNSEKGEVIAKRLWD